LLRYTLRQLDYFIAAGETRSITLASERINISQASISTAISHLEREFGVQLFVRHHAQGLSLTPVGRALLAEAKRLVAQAEALYAIASEATGQLRGGLSVGCMVTLAPMIMPELAHGFTAAFPETTIRQVEADQERLLDWLRRAELDIAVTYDLQIPEDIEFQPLASLPPHVVVSEAHPLARRPAVGLAELAAEPLILLDLPISREYFLALFLAEGVAPQIHARSAYQEVVRTMVANGYGYTLANVRPRSDLALDGRRVVRVPLTGAHRPMVIGLATLGALKRSRLLGAFERHCRAVISDAQIPGMVAPGADGCGSAP
jgi:DNA-binding transcriptional LysR family regulator